jgi:hypothetical protein
MKPIAHRWSEALAGLKLEAIPAIVILEIEGVRLQWLKLPKRIAEGNRTVAMVFGERRSEQALFMLEMGQLAQVCPIISIREAYPRNVFDVSAGDDSEDDRENNI